MVKKLSSVSLLVDKSLGVGFKLSKAYIRLSLTISLCLLPLDQDVSSADALSPCLPACPCALPTPVMVME